MDPSRIKRRLDARSSHLLSAQETAERLGIAISTLYDWLSQSDYGQLVIRGQSVSVDYFQGGSRGEGKIQIEVAEVERIKDLMRVKPKLAPRQRTVSRHPRLPHIRGPLGRPDET